MIELTATRIPTVDYSCKEKLDTALAGRKLCEWMKEQGMVAIWLPVTPGIKALQDFVKSLETNG